MAHVICDPCIDVRGRSCVDACPVHCIHDAGDHLAIDPATCVDCGACVPPARSARYISIRTSRRSGIPSSK